MGTNCGLLFARPSFIEGLARILDLGGTLQEYNSSLTPSQADFLAILSDWRSVSEDMSRAMLEMIGSCGEDVGELLLEEATAALRLDRGAEASSIQTNV